MKSKISFFNWGVSKNLLKRYWPLWGTYFAILLLFVLTLISSTWDPSADRLTVFLSYYLLSSSNTLVLLSFVVCVIVARTMFGYLYNAKSCGMMNALPIRRESMFVTVYLTGLVPMLAADMLVMAILAALCGAYVPGFILWKWFSMAALCNLTFYSIAVFCAMLTGSAVILTVLYAVINFAAILTEVVVVAIPSAVTYGFFVSDFYLDKLSPIYELLANIYVEPDLKGLESVTEIAVVNYAIFWVYGVVALLLTVASLWLYRRRAMETASDTIAVSALKPIFKYGLCFGGAGVFAAAIYNWFFERVFTGFAAAGLTLVLLLIGAFIFYFASEMLLQKSVRVFRGKWKGFIISCLIITAFMVCVELDVFGYERYVPKASEVESVVLDYKISTQLEAPENISAAEELHRLIIDEKTQIKNTDDVRYLSLEYALKNGKTVSRGYYIPSGEEQLDDPSSALYLLQNLENTLEARQNRVLSAIPVTSENIYSASIYIRRYQESGMTLDKEISLSPAEAVLFYNSCILADLKDSSLGSSYIYCTEEHYQMESNANLVIELWRPDEQGQDESVQRYSATVTMDAAHSVKWIKEHGGDTLMSMGESETFLWDED